MMSFLLPWLLNEVFRSENFYLHMQLQQDECGGPKTRTASVYMDRFKVVCLKITISGLKSVIYYHNFLVQKSAQLIYVSSVYPLHSILSFDVFLKISIINDQFRKIESKWFNCEFQLQSMILMGDIVKYCSRFLFSSCTTKQKNLNCSLCWSALLALYMRSLTSRLRKMQILWQFLFNQFKSFSFSSLYHQMHLTFFFLLEKQIKFNSGCKRCA